MKSTKYVLLIAWCLGLTSTVRAQDPPPLPAGDECIACHLDVEEIPDDFLEYDVHLKEGLSCVGCHGGDATIDDDELAKAPGTGYIGIPPKSDIPKLCGECHSDAAFMHDAQPSIHTDQEEQYYISAHGQKLLEGNQNVADCSSCHTAHGILSASDARSSVYALNVPETCQTCHSDADYMKGSGLRTNQFSDYAGSVHGTALLEDMDIGAPACNDCHGNHGALPPDISSMAQVCGMCHINNEQFFLESAMAEPFEEDELHACVECHGYHDVDNAFDEMVGVGESAICMDCHDEGEDGYEAAQQIYEHLSTLVAASDSAEVQRLNVARIGMDDIDIEYLLKDAHQSLIYARTLVHTFDAEKVAEKTDEGIALAREAMTLSSIQVEEHGARRFGLGLATLFITILALGLFLKIRTLDKR